MRAKADPPATPGPPEVIAFDVLETLFSMDSLQPVLVAAGGDASTLPTWFAHLLADGFALTAAREYRPFRDVAKDSLRAVLPKIKATAADKVLAAMAKLDVLPDAGPAMGRAVQQTRVVVVANTSADMTRKLLAKGGLDAFVETTVTPEDVKQWKPGSDPYSYAAAIQSVPAEGMAMVTAHPWDVLGARKAGLTTGWCNRQGRAFPSTFGAPVVTGATLLDVVEGLLALGG